jgi:hypothetical protein
MKIEIFILYTLFTDEQPAHRSDEYKVGDKTNASKENDDIGSSYH